MEKHCEICNKKYNARRKEQKYCSVQCQYESYRKTKIEKVKTICLFCEKEFYTLPNKLKKGKSKYCCRKCKDNHQKNIYTGSSNPSYERVITDSEKKIRSEITKKLWQQEDYKQKIKKGISSFVEKNGHWPGTNEDSKMKRKQTLLDKFGFEHNWVGKYGERKCDNTTLKLYGKTSVEMLNEYSHYYGKKTDIELIFEELLIELSIPYQVKFRIYDKKRINFWFREYDFLLLDTSILIEVDGDYWHGNENIFEQLSDFQKSVKENDKIKEEFAIKNGYKILRFWGEDIKNKKEQVKNKIKELWQKLS
jgi:very-short-patch-repair endonuclease